MATPAEPGGQKKFYFFLQILGGEKLAALERLKTFRSRFGSLFGSFFAFFKPFFVSISKFFRGQFRSADMPP